MKMFVAVLSFAMLACATAKPGYSYQQPQEVVQQTYFPSAPLTSFVPSAQPVQYTQTQFAGSAPQYTASGSAAFAPSQQFVGSAPQYVAPVQQTVASSSQYQQPQQQVIVNKEIFIHSAPEETEVIGEQQDIEAGPVHKNYRIVFIKAPAQNIKLNVDSLKRAQAANEEKTVIYVLSKKPELGHIQSQLINVHNEQKTSKPEVFFIKYKTQEEAIRAQQEIQSQYDALGGSTRVSDEGFAPVTSVIGGQSAIGGHSVSAGSVGPSFVSSGSVVGSSGSFGSAAPTFTSSGSVSGGANYVHSSSSNQQFVHSTQSTGSFGVQAPSDKYLPIIKKK